jgi:integrase
LERSSGRNPSLAFYELCANLTWNKKCRSGGIWQTRCLEGAVPVRACGFDSRLRHQLTPTHVFIYKGNGLKKIRNAFLLTCKRANIKSLRFQDLRHTFATRLVLSGIDLATVSKLLGRSSIHMTMRYSHPTPEALKKAVEALNSPKSEKSVSNSVSSKIGKVEAF